MNTDKLITELTTYSDFDKMYHFSKNDIPMPTTSELKEIVEIIRDILFPGYFKNSNLKAENLKYYMGVNIDNVRKKLSRQIHRALCFSCAYKNTSCNTAEYANDITENFINNLPEIRKILYSDVEATFLGDPAAYSYSEIIYCYPGIRAITNYRIAHSLVKLNIPVLPRIIGEMAHFETGIDIHPEAQIGKSFTIDHGTGIVIGATCIIGDNVKIYQGVTLGAKSFPLDKDGNPIKGVPRHPILEDNVVVYSGATVLGRITVGKNSIIGGNVWVTNDLRPNSKVLLGKQTEILIHGAGI